MPSRREKSSVLTEELIKNINELKKKIQLSGKHILIIFFVFNASIDA